MALIALLDTEVIALTIVVFQLPTITTDMVADTILLDMAVAELIQVTMFIALLLLVIHIHTRLQVMAQLIILIMALETGVLI